VPFFSLAPWLVIVIWIAGLAFGEEAARGQIAQHISALAGARAGEAIQATVQASASEKTTGVLATIIGLVVLFFGASTVFVELKDALNTIWGVAVKPGRAFFTLVRDRFLSFSIVLAIGFLLLVSLVLSAVLAALGKYMSARLPLPAALWQACDFLVSFTVISALFAMIFKILPNSSCILFFGAEFTKVYARKFGSGIVPNSRAMLVSDLLRAKLGSAPTSR
jgi:membrane protein